MRVLFLILSIFFLSCKKEKPATIFSGSKPVVQEEIITTKPVINSAKLIKKAEEALQFNKDNNMNTDFCILIDMSLHSGVKRFFIWNFKNQKVETSYLVGHGCGDATWSLDETKNNPQFSNVDASHLSSLGKYRIGDRGYSSWGIHVKYLMHGLEDSNSNALKRIIVFHSWEMMSDDEVFPKGSPEGWGCPTVSNNAMKIIDKKLQSSKKPVLMWIFN